MSELLQTLAFLFKRKGAASLSRSEFKHAASLDLRWFAPADAKELLEHALRIRLLVEEGDRVRPAFDVDEVEVAFNFKPTTSVLTEHVPVPEAAPQEDSEASDLVERVAREAAQAGRVPYETILREIEEEKERSGGMLLGEAAALVVARRRGVDPRAYVEAAYAALKNP